MRRKEKKWGDEAQESEKKGMGSLLEVKLRTDQRIPLCEELEAVGKKKKVKTADGPSQTPVDAPRGQRRSGKPESAWKRDRGVDQLGGKKVGDVVDRQKRG